MDDDGASHPQAGVRWRGQNEPLWRALRDPTQGNLLAGLPAGMPQLGARQQPSGPPGDVETRRDISAQEDTAMQSSYEEKLQIRKTTSGEK